MPNILLFIKYFKNCSAGLDLVKGCASCIVLLAQTLCSGNPSDFALSLTVTKLAGFDDGKAEHTF